MLTKDFVKKVFADDKKLFKLKDVNFVNAPHYDEISVKNLYPKLMELENMKDYFPDKYPKGR